MTDEPATLARRILRYLESHPEAKESLEGIAEWWLLQEKINESVEDVSQALNWLVANGYLIERRIPNNKSYYKINPKNITEVSRFRRQQRNDE